MAFVVRTYLSSGFDHVILSSIVLSDQEITDRILRLVREGGDGGDGVPDHDVVRFILTADERILRARALARDGEGEPQLRLRERAATLRGTVHVDTTGRSPERRRARAAVGAGQPQLTLGRFSTPVGQGRPLCTDPWRPLARGRSSAQGGSNRSAPHPGERPSRGGER